MSNLTISDFWVHRLQGKRVVPSRQFPGWHFQSAALDAFVEAPLVLSADFDTGQNPETAEVLLVAAPGAVGKSTLARQIAAATNAIYVDLAQADAVGANSLSGVLARSGIHGDWERGEVAVLIDGLDEARLRVTQQGFEAFLKDVGETAAGRAMPTVLFGRTGAVGDAWLELSEVGARTAVLEIGYYGPDAAAQFAETRLRGTKNDRAHDGPRREAIELILKGLRERTEEDRGRFAGYAPVLSAVAERVASDPNPGGLIAEIHQGQQPITLGSVLSAIMERERKKLGNLQFEDPTLLDTLYDHTEQLVRLASLRYGAPPPSVPPMSPNDAQVYSKALQTWVVEHPFLDGSRGASAVFDAIIVSYALSNPDFSAIAADQELKRGSAANPFISEFFVEEFVDGEQLINPEHIGVVYNSIKAQLSIGQSANLSLNAVESDDELEALSVDVEISIEKSGSVPSRILRFTSDQMGVFRLGPHVDDVDAFLPEGSVELGGGDELSLVSPVSIQCKSMKIISSKVVVEAAAGKGEGAVSLEAENFEGTVTTVPVIRGVSFSAIWPNVRQHPWTPFAGNPTEVDDPGISEGLRRLRKFIIAFRSHSKGALKRYRAKLDHARMTKGSGRVILDRLKSDGILWVDGPMYVLEPDVLAKAAGANYSVVMSQNYSQETVDYVRGVLKE